MRTGTRPAPTGIATKWCNDADEFWCSLHSLCSHCIIHLPFVRSWKNYIYIHIYIDICTHTHTYIYICIYVCVIFFAIKGICLFWGGMLSLRHQQLLDWALIKLDMLQKTNGKSPQRNNLHSALMGFCKFRLRANVRALLRGQAGKILLCVTFFFASAVAFLFFFFPPLPTQLQFVQSVHTPGARWKRIVWNCA